MHSIHFLWVGRRKLPKLVVRIRVLNPVVNKIHIYIYIHRDFVSFSHNAQTLNKRLRKQTRQIKQNENAIGSTRRNICQNLIRSRHTPNQITFEMNLLYRFADQQWLSIYLHIFSFNSLTGKSCNQLKNCTITKSRER